MLFLNIKQTKVGFTSSSKLTDLSLLIAQTGEKQIWIGLAQLSDECMHVADGERRGEIGARFADVRERLGFDLQTGGGSQIIAVREPAVVHGYRPREALKRARTAFEQILQPHDDVERRGRFPGALPKEVLQPRVSLDIADEVVVAADRGEDCLLYTSRCV